MVDPKLVAASAISLAVSLFAIFSLRPLARRFGLTDKPDLRKNHHGRIPLIGGLCFFLGMLVGLCYLGNLDYFTISLVAGSVLIVVVGAIDDFHDLSVRARIFIEVGIVGWVIAVTGYYIDGLGPLFGSGEFRLGWFGIPLTLFATIGLINAYNMLDGIDGLAAAIAMTTIGAMLLMVNAGGVHPGALLLLEVLFAALVPYVCVNLGWPDGRKVFMGDAGSTLLGFLLAWGLIYLGHSSVRRLAPIDALWCVALPVMDMLAVIHRRVRLGRSPFKPDRQHLHHLLLDAGFSPRAVLLLIVSAACALSLLGYAVRGLPDLFSTAVFLAATVAYLFWGERLISMAGRLRSLVVADVAEGSVSAPLDADDEAAGIGDSSNRFAANGASPLRLVHGDGVAGMEKDPDESTPLRALCVVPSLEDALMIAPIFRNMAHDDRFEPTICAEYDAKPMLDAMDLRTDFDLDEETGAAEHGPVTAAALRGMECLFGETRPDLVLVSGHSSTAVATSLAARACDIPVVCIGADPHPATEGGNGGTNTADAGRKIVRTLAALHVTSSESAGRGLIADGIAPECVLVTRNDGQMLDALNGLHENRNPEIPATIAPDRNEIAAARAVRGIHGVSQTQAHARLREER